MNYAKLILGTNAEYPCAFFATNFLGQLLIDLPGMQMMEAFQVFTNKDKIASLRYWNPNEELYVRGYTNLVGITVDPATNILRVTLTKENSDE